MLRLLERVGRRRSDASGDRPGRRRGPAPEPLAPPRGPLVLAMGGFLAVALVAMLGFEHALTRVIGVLCIFGFIVSGVFAVADPRFLTVDEQEVPPPAGGERG
jgi:hypothetical protein